MIKRYHELVDRGIIRQRSVFDNYDAPAFLERVLSFEEMQRLVEEGEREALRLEEKTAKEIQGIFNRVPLF